MTAGGRCAAGRILFPGRTNNEMLKLMMDAKGAFPKKMLRRAAFAEKHFEDDVNMSFRLWEEDPVSKRPARPDTQLGRPLERLCRYRLSLMMVVAVPGRLGRSSVVRLCVQWLASCGQAPGAPWRSACGASAMSGLCRAPDARFAKVMKAHGHVIQVCCSFECCW